MNTKTPITDALASAPSVVIALVNKLETDRTALIAALVGAESVLVGLRDDHDLKGWRDAVVCRCNMVRATLAKVQS